METKIQKWGNSLALRIPKAFARDIKISQNSTVGITLEEGRLVVTPMIVDKFDLDSLISQITDDNLHREIDSGIAIGKEVW